MKITKAPFRLIAPVLLVGTLSLVPAESAFAQNKPTQKSSQNKNTQKTNQQKAKTTNKNTKSTQKKSDNKAKTTNKNTSKTTKKPTTQPSTDGKGVIPVSSHDADGKTLLEQQAPTEEELSLANKELLAKNAQLERQVNALTTQNNVLTQEKSGQLFMYGTLTAIFSVILGGLVVKLFGNRKERW